MDIGYHTDTENVRKQALLDLMKDMSLPTLSIAYLYAKNYTKYGADVTRDWLTAIENTAALEKAYKDGYYDGLQRMSESEDTNI